MHPRTETHTYIDFQTRHFAHMAHSYSALQNNNLIHTHITNVNTLFFTSRFWTKTDVKENVFLPKCIWMHDRVAQEITVFASYFLPNQRMCNTVSISILSYSHWLPGVKTGWRLVQVIYQFTVQFGLSLRYWALDWWDWGKKQWNIWNRGGECLP